MKRHSLCYFVALPAMLLALSAQATHSSQPSNPSVRRGAWVIWLLLVKPLARSTFATSPNVCTMSSSQPAFDYLGR